MTFFHPHVTDAYLDDLRRLLILTIHIDYFYSSFIVFLSVFFSMENKSKLV